MCGIASNHFDTSYNPSCIDPVLLGYGHVLELSVRSVASILDGKSSVGATRLV